MAWQCIHPGSKPVIGYDNIMNMWISMFTANDSAFQITKIKPANVRVHVRGTSAYVMCTEEVRTLIPSSASAQLITVYVPILQKYIWDTDNNPLMMDGRSLLAAHHAA
jgi:hypothetical protein